MQYMLVRNLICIRYLRTSRMCTICTLQHAEQEDLIVNAEAEFLDVIGTKVLGVFLLAIQSHLY